MNKNQHTCTFALASLGMVLWFFMGMPQSASSQNSWEQENYQQQYRTSNTGTGEWVDWEDENWKIWVKNGNAGSWEDFNGYPPFASDENSTYIEIQVNDKIKLNSTLAYKNNLTLWVCGVLDIGTLSLQEMVPSVVLNQQDVVIDRTELTISVNAEYFSETVVEGNGTGFYIAPVGVDDPINPVYKILRSDSTHYYDHELDHFQGTFSIGPIDRLADGTLFQAGQSYQVIAYAVNSTGTGYSVIREFHFDEATPEPEEDEINAFNRIRLWICKGGELTIGTIESKNNALLHIDGALIVEEFLFDTNNYCITGTGSISTSAGEAPPISGNPSNHCAGFDGILPIELLDFSSEIRPDLIRLSWSTASEINNDYFTIERSRDLYSWEVVGYVEGSGNSNQILSYDLEDRSPMPGLTYYRLKQTDFDGQFEVFEPLAVNYETGLNGLDFTITKNSGQWIVNLPGQDPWQVEVYSLHGRKIFSGTATRQFTLPAQDQAVVIRLFNGSNQPVSRIIL